MAVDTRGNPIVRDAARCNRLAAPDGTIEADVPGSTATVHLDAARAKRVAKAHGCGVNDVLLDGVAVGAVTAVTVAVPVSMTMAVPMARDRLATLCGQAAGLLAPVLAADPGINRELLVVSMGFGSLFLSHLNDGGFWLVKEVLGLTVGETVRTWTALETIIGVAGLGFTLALAQVM